MAETDLIHDQSTIVPMQEFGGPSRGPCRFALPGAGAARLPMYAACAVTVACDESPCGNRVIASGPLPGADQCILPLRSVRVLWHVQSFQQQAFIPTMLDL